MRLANPAAKALPSRAAPTCPAAKASASGWRCQSKRGDVISVIAVVMGGSPPNVASCLLVLQRVAEDDHHVDLPEVRGDTSNAQDQGDPPIEAVIDPIQESALGGVGAGIGFDPTRGDVDDPVSG